MPSVEGQLGGFAAKKSSMVTARHRKGLIHAIQYRRVRLNTLHFAGFRVIQVEMGPYAKDQTMSPCFEGESDNWVGVTGIEVSGPKEKHQRVGSPQDDDIE